MTTNRVFRLTIDALRRAPTPFRTCLTCEQLETLSACAQGISLRLEQAEVVNALVAGGFAERSVAGVVTVTLKGREYLRAHEFRVGGSMGQVKP